MPFELSSLLGLPSKSAKIQALTDRYKEEPSASELKDGEEPVERSYIRFYDSGFSLLVNDEGIVDTIHVYTRPEGAFESCKLGVPHGFSLKTTQAAARKKLGVPSKQGGPVRAVLPPHDTLYWDRWDLDDHYFHLTYSAKKDAVHLVTLGMLPRTPDA